MGQFAIGQSVPRIEDPRLLRGEGQYVDDIHLNNETHAYILRSPHAHARITQLDCEAARSMLRPASPWPPQGATRRLSFVLPPASSTGFGHGESSR